jgi:dolichol-phosphate mannosyltransferase
MITWMPIKDPTAGFVCYRNKVLSTIDLDKIRFVGYAFQIEMKFMSWKLGFNIKEVYITFKDRIYGASKMSKGIIKEGVVGVLSMQLNSILHGVSKKESIQ